MTSCSESVNESRRDLDERLAPRRVIEALNGSARRGRRRHDFLLRHHRTLAPILRAGLKLAGLYSRGVENARNPIVRRVRFEFPGLPAGFDGFTILHLADLHIDGWEGLPEAIAERVAGLPADLCVMTGDYRYDVDGPCDAVYSGMETILSSVQADHGVFAILGNHDAAEIAVELENFGVRMLINEAVEVRQGSGSFWVAGVDDPHYYGCDDLPTALENIPRNAFKVLLAHTPEIFEEAAGSGIHLYLCGHTHAGQICLPLLGAPLLNATCPKAYKRGGWSHAGMQGYTSSGIGASMVPVRYNCPPEIVLIELGSKL